MKSHPHANLRSCQFRILGKKTIEAAAEKLLHQEKSLETSRSLAVDYRQNGKSIYIQVPDLDGYSDFSQFFIDKFGLSLELAKSKYKRNELSINVDYRIVQQVFGLSPKQAEAVIRSHLARDDRSTIYSMDSEVEFQRPLYFAFGMSMGVILNYRTFEMRCDQLSEPLKLSVERVQSRPFSMPETLRKLPVLEFQTQKHTGHSPEPEVPEPTSETPLIVSGPEVVPPVPPAPRLSHPDFGYRYRTFCRSVSRAGRDLRFRLRPAGSQLRCFEGRVR